MPVTRGKQRESAVSAALTGNSPVPAANSGRLVVQTSSRPPHRSHAQLDLGIALTLRAGIEVDCGCEGTGRTRGNDVVAPVGLGRGGSDGGRHAGSRRACRQQQGSKLAITGEPPVAMPGEPFAGGIIIEPKKGDLLYISIFDEY